MLSWGYVWCLTGTDLDGALCDWGVVELYGMNFVFRGLWERSCKGTSMWGFGRFSQE